MSVLASKALTEGPPGDPRRSRVGWSPLVPPIASTVWLPLITAAAMWSVLFARWHDLTLEGDHVAHLRLAAIMAVSMMTPVAIPLCVQVDRSTLWWHRRRATAVACASFLVVWAAAMLVLHVLTEPFRAVSTELAVGLALVCVPWSMSRRRDVVLRSCTVSGSIRQSRWLRDTISLSTTVAFRCIVACAIPMVICALTESLAVAAVVAVVVAAERLLMPRPRIAIAVGYALLAVIAAAALVAPVALTQV